MNVGSGKKTLHHHFYSKSFKWKKWKLQQAMRRFTLNGQRGIAEELLTNIPCSPTCYLVNFGGMDLINNLQCNAAFLSKVRTPDSSH